MGPFVIFLPLPPPLFNETLEGLLLVGTQQRPDPFLRPGQYQASLGMKLAPDLPHLSVGLLNDTANSLPLESVELEFAIHLLENHLGHGTGPPPHHPFHPLLMDEMCR